VLDYWQKTSLQQLVNKSAFRPFEIATIKEVKKGERQARKKNFINARNRRKWMEFARECVNKPIDF
jgi:hypothetical protein